MLVLLPPSEWRLRMVEALATASAGPDALGRLGVGASLSAEVARNTRLLELPTVQVSAVYTGVLYDALDWPTLEATTRRRGNDRLIVISALWGALRPRDRVPAYRLSMNTTLPGVGPLAAAWRQVLGPELVTAAGRRGLIVDCRSSTYAAAWTPVGALAARTIAVRVLRDGPQGRSVVSHMAKHTRGEVARHLLVTGADPRSAAECAEVLAERWEVELVAPVRKEGSLTLDVIVNN